jgi:hypothetical protein
MCFIDCVSCDEGGSQRLAALEEEARDAPSAEVGQSGLHPIRRSRAADQDDLDTRFAKRAQMRRLRLW